MNSIAIVAAHYPPAFRAGGPTRSLQAMLAKATTTEGVVLLTSDRDLGSRDPLPVEANQWSTRDGVTVRYTSAHKLTKYVAGLLAVRRMRPDILYLNGMFDLRFSIAPALLARVGFWRGARLVVAPRGELDPGALAVSAAKKRAFLRLARMIGLYQDLLWHASAEVEAAHVRAAKLSDARVLVHQNETLLPRVAAWPAAEGQQVPRLVFVSRVSPKKGLHILLEAAHRVRAPMVLDIYGEAIDAEYLERCRDLAAKAPDHVSLRFCGPLLADQVRETIVSYDAFFFPTAGENFGHAIVEALSCSIPVFLADVTPWTPVASRLGTLLPSLDVDTWTAALDSFNSSSPQERTDLRRRAGAEYNRWATTSLEQRSLVDILRDCPTRRNPREKVGHEPLGEQLS